MIQAHPYHLVDPSPWPLLGSLGATCLTLGLVLEMHSFLSGRITLFIGIAIILFCMYIWWRDIIREATYQGHHTLFVQYGLRYGMILFITSEILFFFAFFWAFFNASLVPPLEIGAIWPPKGIDALNPWMIPFVNSLILLTSGAAVTWAHHAILSSKNKETVTALIFTIVLAIIFTAFQGFEYLNSFFTLSDSVYGSTFFLATGFHGAHVIIGTIFLSICLYRVTLSHFTANHHFHFEAAAWYWHFVDAVWLFLFVSIYWWGYQT